MADNPIDPSQVKETQKVVDVLSNSLADLLNRLNSLGTAGKKSFEGLRRGAKSVKEELEDLEDHSIDASDAISDIEHEILDAARASKKMALDRTLPLAKLIETQDALKKLADRAVKLREDTSKGIIDQKALDAATTELGTINEEINKINMSVGRAPKRWSKFGDAVGDVSDAAGHVGSMFSAIGAKSPRALMQSGKAASGFAKEMVAGGQEMAGMGNKVAGMLLKTLGGALGSVAKMLTGPVGWVAMGIKAIVDISMAADKFVKDANLRFAQVRGPDIMTSDIQGQFKDFNDQLYDIGENLRVGLDPKEVAGFVESIVAAGTHLNKLSDGFHSYRYAVDVAAKASKTLGVELPTVANMMSQMINELRMNIGDIDSLFAEVAFDAQKAGLSTDRFWGAIENATASLGFYGVFIDKASKTFASFNKTGIMGTKEATDVVTNLSQAFVNMSSSQRAAVVDFGGGVKYFQKQATKELGSLKKKRDQILKDREEISEEMAGPDVSPKRREELQAAMEKSGDQLDAVNTNIAELTRASKQNNAVAMQAYLPYFSDTSKGMAVLTSIMNKAGIKDWKNLSGENIILAEKFAEELGYNKNLIQELHKQAGAISEHTDRALGTSEDQSEYQKSFLSNLEKLNASGAQANVSFGTQMDNLITKVTEGSTATQDQIDYSAGVFKRSLQDAGIDKTSAETIANLIKIDKNGETTKKIRALLKLSGKELKTGVAEFKKSYDSGKVANEMMAENGNIFSETQQALQKRADGTFTQIRKGTLSYKKMMDITKEGITWQAASLAAQVTLNGMVSDIVSLLEKPSGWLSGEQKEALKSLKEKGLTGASHEEQFDFQRKTIGEIHELQLEMANQADAQQALADYEKSGKSNDDFLKLQKKLENKLTPKQKEQFQLDIKNGKKTFPEILKGIGEQVKTDNEHTVELQNSLEQLKVLGDLQNKALDVATLSLSDSPDALASLGDILGKTIEETGDVPLAINKMGYGSKAGLEILKRAVAERDKRVTDNEKVTRASDPLKGAKEYFAKSQQGLTKPLPITKPTTLTLHAGEMVMPKGFTLPGSAAGPAAGMAGGSKSININVSATEKDLAQRIANEVRGVLYKEQMTGRWA